MLWSFQGLIGELKCTWILSPNLVRENSQSGNHIWAKIERREDDRVTSRTNLACSCNQCSLIAPSSCKRRNQQQHASPKDPVDHFLSWETLTEEDRKFSDWRKRWKQGKGFKAYSSAQDRPRLNNQVLTNREAPRYSTARRSVDSLRYWLQWTP